MNKAILIAGYTHAGKDFIFGIVDDLIPAGWTIINFSDTLFPMVVATVTRLQALGQYEAVLQALGAQPSDFPTIPEVAHFTIGGTSPEERYAQRWKAAHRQLYVDFGVYTRDPAFGGRAESVIDEIIQRVKTGTGDGAVILGARMASDFDVPLSMVAAGELTLAVVIVKAGEEVLEARARALGREGFGEITEQERQMNLKLRELESAGLDCLFTIHNNVALNPSHILDGTASAEERAAHEHIRQEFTAALDYLNQLAPSA